MTIAVANVFVSNGDTFQVWVDRTNTLLTYMSNNVVTVGATATGNGSTGNGYITGTFGATTLVAQTALRGGDIDQSNTLVISSVANVANVLYVTGNTSVQRLTVAGIITGSANVNIDSGVLFVDVANNRVGVGTSTPDANLQVVGNANVSGDLRATGNVHAAYLHGNGSQITGIAAAVAGSNTQVQFNDSNTFGGDSGFTYNKQTNTVAIGNTLSVPNMSGNINFDSGVLYIDSANNRVGVGTTTPDANLHVVGTANVSGAVRLGGTLNVTGLTTANQINSTTANSSTAVNVGANVNLTTTSINVGNSTVNSSLTATALHTDGTLTVLGAAALSNTLSVTGNATFSNTSAFTGLITSSGGINTTTANASAGVNVGANVNLTTSAVRVGNSTVNSTLTATAITVSGVQYGNNAQGNKYISTSSPSGGNNGDVWYQVPS